MPRMTLLEPRSPGFNTVKQLLNRMALPSEESRISSDDEHVPAWQRQIVWTDDEMGLLILSIVRNFPIGLLILWAKTNGVRVPIDGRQRLTAIKKFSEGLISIPDMPMVPDEFKRGKYILGPDDEEAGYVRLPLEFRESFDAYELSVIQYDGIPEKVAMEIFVMLQGGKSLTKTEIRAALGGKLCEFVSVMTQHRGSGRHAFFQELSRNLKDRRKSHRNVCDVLLHEVLYPGHDKHWTSLEKMYREKSDQFSAADRRELESQLNRFLRAVTIEAAGVRRMMPQLRNVFFILDVFRAWRELANEYDVPGRLDFARAIGEFETERAARPAEVPWIVYTNELSNAGYAKNRLDSRHAIMMSFLLQRFDAATPRRRDRRSFTTAQKLAIWERAGHRCEWQDAGRRCRERFADFEMADADHIIRWTDRGPTTVANGRLLCRAHNRGRGAT